MISDHLNLSSLKKYAGLAFNSSQVDKVIYDEPNNFKALLLFTLLFIQCSLLHPTFSHSRLARLIRISLTPINFFWSFTFPFRPSSKSHPPASFVELISASFALYGAIKSLEWGFSPESYYTRPLQVIDGVKKWQKASDELHTKKQEVEPCSFFQLITWTLLQLSSARGLQFTWGPAVAANTQSTYSLLWRLFRVNIPFTCVSAFMVLSRDSPDGTPESALLSLGFPKFPGLALLSETIYTACFGIWAACSLDIRYTLITLVATLIHKLATLFKCRQEILELFDPIYYPPMFYSPHKSPSLAHFWGQGWHTALQRMFLVAGGKPMLWITKKIGASTKTQRLAGLLGTFAASGAAHEYLSFVWTQGREMSHPHSAFFFSRINVLFHDSSIRRDSRTLLGTSDP